MSECHLLFQRFQCYRYVQMRKQLGSIKMLKSSYLYCHSYSLFRLYHCLEWHFCNGQRAYCRCWGMQLSRSKITDRTECLLRPSKGGSLVALSHPSAYLCRLTSGGNCHCRFSVQIHMSLSLQKFVCDVSVR